MSLEIREAVSKKDRRTWVRFVFSHYRDHEFHVPQIISDEIAYFDPRKNPAFDVCQVKFFLAWRDGKPVGRVCGIISSLETEKLGCKVGRFGWFETVEDSEVSGRLLDHVGDWLKSEGCVKMTGPQGFTDLDPGGVLLDGYDQVPTIAGSYHHSFYPGLMDAYGLQKEVDYVEFRMDVSKPVKFLERIRKRLQDDHYTIGSPRSRKDLVRKSDAVWALMEESYTHLYGVMPLTRAQEQFYTKKYLSLLDPDFVTLAYDGDGTLVGFLVALPNLSHAFRRARGKLFPLGFAHILRAYRKPETLDLLMAAAKPDEPSTLLTAMGLLHLYDVLRRRGIRYMETNRELETNTTVHRVWRKFDVVSTRRTRIYRMEFD